MSTDRCREESVINIDREEIERVSSFKYLGARIQANRKTTPEIRRRLAMATTKLNKMANVWKGQCVDMKIRFLKSTVFPTVTYGYEAWTINKIDGKLITAFEMKCYRKILRIPWTERATNEKVLEKVKMNSTTLLQEIRKIFWAHQTPWDTRKAQYWKQRRQAEEEGEGQWGDGNKISRTGLKQQHKQEEWRKIECCFARKSEKQRPTRDQVTDWVAVVVVAVVVFVVVADAADGSFTVIDRQNPNLHFGVPVHLMTLISLIKSFFFLFPSPIADFGWLDFFHRFCFHRC